MYGYEVEFGCRTEVRMPGGSTNTRQKYECQAEMRMPDGCTRCRTEVRMQGGSADIKQHRNAKSRNVQKRSEAFRMQPQQ
jgi:hypothetical protein